MSSNASHIFFFRSFPISISRLYFTKNLRLHWIAFYENTKLYCVCSCPCVTFFFLASPTFCLACWNMTSKFFLTISFQSKYFWCKHIINLVLLKFNQFGVLCISSNGRIFTNALQMTKKDIYYAWIARECDNIWKFVWCYYHCEELPVQLVSIEVLLLKSFILQYAIKLVIERNKICIVDIFICALQIIVNNMFFFFRQQDSEIISDKK